MGGGLELALGCHYRVARAGAQIALPEVKLGLMPGAGGTQRLPRVLGVETALNMIVSRRAGAERDARQGTGQKLFDEMVEGDLLDGALAFARRRWPTKRPLPRVRDLQGRAPEAEAYLQFARNTVGAMAKNFPAPLKCVDAVAAAVTKTFDDGMRFERELFTGADAHARVAGAAPRVLRRARRLARSPTCPRTRRRATIEQGRP